jgi:DNA-binding NarL/FixJ family response regulator
MAESIRILLVDGYAPFRHHLRSTLELQPEFHAVGEASDELDAVHKARQLGPDLILLDIGLPELTGIETARRIRESAPHSKAIFLSESCSWNVAEEALRSGARGYVVKSDTVVELLHAIESVLQGKRFVSASLAGHAIKSRGARITGHHQAGLYFDDRWLIEDVTHFIASSLKAGNATIVMATESHRDSFLSKLAAHGVDAGTAIEHGNYIALDAAETLAAFMLGGMPEPSRFMQAFGSLVQPAMRAATGRRPRVAVFGECVDLLCAQGNVEAAIQMERLGNKLAAEYRLDILCGYSVHKLHSIVDGHIFHRIRAQHSAVHFH